MHIKSIIPFSTATRVGLHYFIRHVNDLNKEGERATLHRGDISRKENSLTFHQWNPFHLKLWPSVGFGPCHPSRSLRASGLCSPEVWPAFTLQGLRHLPVMLNLILGSQETGLLFGPTGGTDWTDVCTPSCRQQNKHCCIIQQRQSSRKSKKGSSFVVWSLFTLPHVLWFNISFPAFLWFPLILCFI